MLFIGVLGLIGFIVFAVLAIISAMKKSGTTKRNLIALAVCFIVFLVGAVSSSGDTNQKQDKVNATENKKAESKKQNPTYSKEQEKGLIEAYNKVIDDSDGLIIKIEQEDNYNIINVTLDDAFKNLNKSKKQELLDSWGNKIENNTRSRLFGTGVKDFKYVYFKDSKGNHLAKTGHLDRNWKAK